MNRCKKSAHYAFDVALDAGDLSRKIYGRVAFESERPCQTIGRIQITVPVHYAVAHKFCVLQPRDHPEHAALFPKFEICLEPHNVVKRPFRIILPQLNHCKRPFPKARV